MESYTKKYIFYNKIVCDFIIVLSFMFYSKMFIFNLFIIVNYLRIDDAFSIGTGLERSRFAGPVR